MDQAGYSVWNAQSESDATDYMGAVIRAFELIRLFGLPCRDTLKN